MFQSSYVRGYVSACVRASVRTNAHHGGRQTDTYTAWCQSAWVRGYVRASVRAWVRARGRESERTCVLVFLRACMHACVRMSECKCMRVSVRWCVDACVPALVRGFVRVSERGNMVRQTDTTWNLSGHFQQLYNCQLLSNS